MDEKNTTTAVNPTEEKAVIIEQLVAANKRLTEQVESLQAKIFSNQKPVVNVAMPEEQTVTLHVRQECSDKGSTNFGEFGTILGKKGKLVVQHRDFNRFFNSPLVRQFLKTRTMIYENGLTPKEEEFFGLNYAPGEILSESEFDGILNMPPNQIIERFKQLCYSHKVVVARKFISAGSCPNARNKDLMIKLNRISISAFKQQLFDSNGAMPLSFCYPDGMFKPVMDELEKRISI